MNDEPPLGPPSWATAAHGDCVASVLVPVRNNARWIAAALDSVLATRELTLDVLVLDDASTDGTAAAVREALTAAPVHPHAVRFWTRQPHRGLAGNGALTAAAATDRCIVQHGDDVSEPARMRRVVDTFAATGADVISTGLRLLEGESVSAPSSTGSSGFIGAADIAESGPRPPLIGAALAWRRRVFTDFPRLDRERLFLGHDTLVPFRGALRGGYYHLHEPLLRYRQHEGQWSHRLGDRSSTAAAVENQAFRHLAILRAMTLDCRHLQATGLAAAVDLPVLLGRIAARQATLLDFFVQQRESLLRAGQRPLWVDEDCFNRCQLGLDRERFWRRGRWRRLLRWWRERRPA